MSEINDWVDVPTPKEEINDWVDVPDAPQETSALTPEDTWASTDVDELGRPLTPEIKAAEKQTLPLKLGMLSAGVPMPAVALGTSLVGRLASPAVNMAARASVNAATGAGTEALGVIGQGGSTEAVTEAAKSGAIYGAAIPAGIETVLGPLIAAGKIAKAGGKWVMDKSAEALFGGKLTKEMIESPAIQSTLDKVVSAKNAGLSAIGMGKSFKNRVADEAKLAEEAYNKAFNAIPDERIPIDEVFTPEMRSNLDVLPEDNMVRNQIPAFVKKTEARLEPISFKNERLGKEAQQRSSALNKREELRRIIEEKRAAKLAPIQSKFDEDLLAAKQLDLENLRAGNGNKDPEYLKQRKMLENLNPEGIAETVKNSREIRLLDELYQNNKASNLTDQITKEFNLQKSIAESELAQEINPLVNQLQEVGKQIPPTIPKETTLREAYNVANNPIKGDINPLEATLGARVRELGGETVAAADAARQTSQTMDEATKAAIGADSNRATGSDAALAILSPKLWVAKATAAHPELRYVLGKNAEALGKWGDKLESAYNSGGAKAVNVLVNTLNQTDPEFRQAHAGNQQVSPYQEGAEKPQIKKPELSRDEFLKNLGSVESAGKYDATNPNSSATGKYQFLWKTWGDDVSRWAGAPVSQKMFLSNPKLQDLYMKDHHDTTLMQGAKTLRDSSPNASKRSDTELKALIHFKGLEGARKYLDQGVDDTSANNMGVEDYLKKVGGG